MLNKGTIKCKKGVYHESLCPLSDDDLRPMAEAMSKIEDTHERIAKANEALSEARHLAAEYERYNRYMLWKKADLYLKKSVEVNKTKRLLEARNDDILAAEKDYQEADRLLDEALHRLEVLNEEKNGLNISGIEEQLQRKREKAELLARDKNTETKMQKNMEDKQQKVKVKYRECSEIKIKISDCEYEIKKVLSDLQAYEEYCFPFYDAYYLKIRSGEQLQTAECRHECRSFSNRLKQVLQLLKEQERQRAEYESSEQQLSEKQEAVYRCRKSLETAQTMYTEQKDSFIEQMFMARKNNKEFCIDAGLLERLESLVVNYEELLFPNAEPDSIRTRTRITLTWHGHQLPPAVFADDLAAAIENDKLLIKKEEEEMFRTILMNTISKKLYLRIDTSRKWVKSMSELMQGINTSMGLSFSLSWKPKRDIGEHELSFEELNKLLAGDAQLMRAEDYERLSAHFRSRIEHERLVMEEKGQEVNYTELVRNVLDFRNWFEFSLHYRYSGKPLQEMTVSRFNTFSGGERALSLYIPLFAAVAAQYQKAGDQAPRILALDEAFAGVDDSNISEMFALLEKLEFGYILNSQALWGCYDTVPSLAIAELCHEKDSDFITVISYEWNGSHKLLKEEQAVGI